MILFLFPLWIKAPLNNFHNNKIDKYEKSSILNYLPEHLLNSVYEFHSFYCRFKEDYLQLVGE